MPRVSIREIKLYKALRALGLSCESGAKVGGRSIDVFIPPQTCVFYDGYFHTNVGRPERDARIRGNLNRLGYTTIAVSGPKIEESAKYIRELITSGRYKEHPHWTVNAAIFP